MGLAGRGSSFKLILEIWGFIIIIVKEHINSKRKQFFFI